jgi:peptide/nickel transport system substrate-binding protein
MKRSLGAGAVFATPGLLAACGGSSSATSSHSTASSAASAGKPVKGGHLTVAQSDGGSTDVLAPWNIPTASSSARAKQIYERLYTWTPAATPQPELALSAEPDSTRTVWRVKLRSGVTFHNGKTFTADDVVYSTRYILNTKNNAEASSRLVAIDPHSTRAISPTEVEFHLTRPIGDFPGLLADKAFWMVPSGYTDFLHPVGTGPFKLTQHQIGVSYLFERNPHYWETTAAGGPPWVDTLEFHIVTDNTTRLNALLSGQIQEMTSIDFVSARAQASNSSVVVIRTPQPNASAIYVQIDAPHFRDVRVRHALKLLIDRPAYVRNTLLGFGSLGNDLWGKGLPTYNASLPQRTYDPQQAKSLLKAAGMSNFSLTLPAAEVIPGMLELALAFKQGAAVAGLTVNIQKIDPGTYFTNKLYLHTPIYQTFYVDPFENVAQDAFLLKAPYNETHWFSSQWQTNFFKAQAIVDPAQRDAAYQALQVPLWNSGGYIIAGFSDTLDATSSKVHGIVPNKSAGYQNLGGQYFKYHWLSA